MTLHVCYELHLPQLRREWTTAGSGTGLLHPRAAQLGGRVSERRAARCRLRIEDGATADSEMERLSIETDRRIRIPRHFPSLARAPGSRCASTSCIAPSTATSGGRSACLGPSPADRAGQAAFVAVEFDEFGGGPRGSGASAVVRRPQHARRGPRRQLTQATSDVVPCRGELMSLFGLHRVPIRARDQSLRFHRITSSPGSRRLVDLERMDARRAFGSTTEHVEADAVHSRWCTGVVGDLVRRRPTLDRDVVFGIRAHEAVETGWPIT